MWRNGNVYKQLFDWLQTILDFDYNESNIWTDNSLIFLGWFGLNSTS